jgi:hypothetical protein
VVDQRLDRGKETHAMRQRGVQFEGGLIVPARMDEEQVERHA